MWLMCPYQVTLETQVNSFSLLHCRCQWKGVPCNISADFKTTFTNLGVCYTFNADSPPLSVTEPGQLLKYLFPITCIFGCTITEPTGQ